MLRSNWVPTARQGGDLVVKPLSSSVLFRILAGLLHVWFLGRLGPFAPASAAARRRRGGAGAAGARPVRWLEQLWRALVGGGGGGGAGRRAGPRMYGHGTWGDGGSGAYGTGGGAARADPVSLVGPWHVSALLMWLLC